MNSIHWLSSHCLTEKVSTYATEFGNHSLILEITNNATLIGYFTSRIPTWLIDCIYSMDTPCYSNRGPHLYGFFLTFFFLSQLHQLCLSQCYHGLANHISIYGNTLCLLSWYGPFPPLPLLLLMIGLWPPSPLWATSSYSNTPCFQLWGRIPRTI